MNPIFLVVGPPAVGKSTTSRALAARFSRSIHIPVDDIRHMVVSGMALPGAVWSDDLTQQIRLARTSVIQIASHYHTAGFTVIIDDFWDPNHRLDYQAIISQPHTHRILLYPGQGEARQRNLQRSGTSPARAYIDEGIQIVYQQLDAVVPQLAQEGWEIVNTTALNVEATVAVILQRTTVAP